MASIIEKRQSLHRDLVSKQQQNEDLKFQVGQMQALANIGVTTCMVAHEINNLLTPLSSYAELAMNNPDDKHLTGKVLQKTVKNCRRASKIMESMLSVGNGEAKEKQETALLGLVNEIFSCLCRDFGKDSIKVSIEIDKDLSVWGVPVEIQQVLMNLILNARDSMLSPSKGGTLRVSAQDGGDVVQIQVSDTGCGIEFGDLKKIFRPFYTTKSNNDSMGLSGSGLGLAFCRQIVDSHDGSITVESEFGGGTIFVIILPKR